MFMSSRRGCGSSPGQKYSPPGATGLLWGSLPCIHCLPSQLCLQESGFYPGKLQNFQIQVLWLIKEVLHATFLFFFLTFSSPQKYPKIELQAAGNRGERASTATLPPGTGCVLNGFGLLVFLSHRWCQAGVGEKSISSHLSWFIMY